MGGEGPWKVLICAIETIQYTLAESQRDHQAVDENGGGYFPRLPALPIERCADATLLPLRDRDSDATGQKTDADARDRFQVRLACPWPSSGMPLADRDPEPTNQP